MGILSRILFVYAGFACLSAMAVPGGVTATDTFFCEIVFENMAPVVVSKARVDGSGRLSVKLPGSDGPDHFISFPLSRDSFVAVTSGKPFSHLVQTEMGSVRLTLSELPTRPTLSALKQKLYDISGVESIIRESAGIRSESDPITKLRVRIQKAIERDREQIQALIPSWLMEYYKTNRQNLFSDGAVHTPDIQNWKEFFTLRDPKTNGDISVHAENTPRNFAQLYLLYAADPKKVRSRELLQRLAAVCLLRAELIAEARKMLTGP